MTWPAPADQRARPSSGGSSGRRRPSLSTRPSVRQDHPTGASAGLGQLQQVAERGCPADGQARLLMKATWVVTWWRCWVAAPRWCRTVASIRRWSATLIKVIIERIVERDEVVFRRPENVRVLADAPLRMVFTSLTPHKLVRRELLVRHGIRCPEGRLAWEDGIFLSRVAPRAQRISVLQDRAYYIKHRQPHRLSAAFVIRSKARSAMEIVDTLRRLQSDPVETDAIASRLDRRLVRTWNSTRFLRLSRHNQELDVDRPCGARQRCCFPHGGGRRPVRTVDHLRSLAFRTGRVPVNRRAGLLRAGAPMDGAAPPPRAATNACESRAGEDAAREVAASLGRESPDPPALSAGDGGAASLDAVVSCDTHKPAWSSSRAGARRSESRTLASWRMRALGARRRPFAGAHGWAEECAAGVRCDRRSVRMQGNQKRREPGDRHVSRDHPLRVVAGKPLRG